MRLALLSCLACACVPVSDFDAGVEEPVDSGVDSGTPEPIDAGSPWWVVETFAGGGMPGAVDGAGAAARFNDPRGLAIDTTGNLYVADRGNRAVRMIDPFGNVTTMPGAGKFFGPEGVAVDKNGNVYVADTQDECIYRIDYRATKAVPFAGQCRLGDAGFFQCADTGPGSFALPTDAVFGRPGGMVVDNDAGILYVADAEQERVKFVTLGFNQWVGTLAGDGRMAQYDGACGFNHCCGFQYSFIGCMLPQSSAFRQPAGVGLGPNGDLYVADRGNCAVRRIAAPRGDMCRVSTLAGDLSCGDGVQGLNGPVAATAGPDGVVYASDTNNQRVVSLDLSVPQTRRIVTLTAPGAVSNPWGIVVNKFGKVFVVDNGSNRVVTIRPP